MKVVEVALSPEVQVPYNPAQKRLFGLCRHNPEKAQGKCPPKKFLAEYAAEAHKKQQRPPPKFR
jgi:hypothetical protein